MFHLSKLMSLRGKMRTFWNYLRSKIKTMIFMPTSSVYISLLIPNKLKVLPPKLIIIKALNQHRKNNHRNRHVCPY